MIVSAEDFASARMIFLRKIKSRSAQRAFRSFRNLNRRGILPLVSVEKGGHALPRGWLPAPCAAKVRRRRIAFSGGKGNLPGGNARLFLWKPSDPYVLKLLQVREPNVSSFHAGVKNMLLSAVWGRAAEVSFCNMPFVGHKLIELTYNRHPLLSYIGEIPLYNSTFLMPCASRMCISRRKIVL